MDTKFTPGNWQVEPIEASYKPSGLVYLRINSGKSIAFAGVYKDKGISEAEARANAALIAAAPELYAALEMCEADYMHEAEDARAEGRIASAQAYERAAKDIRAVLAKARGEMTAQQTLEREA